jgi:hypothetical protein
MTSFAHAANTALSLSTDPTAASLTRALVFRSATSRREDTEAHRVAAQSSRPLDVLYPSLFVAARPIGGRCADVLHALVANPRKPAMSGRGASA